MFFNKEDSTRKGGGGTRATKAGRRWRDVAAPLGGVGTVGRRREVWGELSARGVRPPPPRGVNFLLGGPDPLSKRFLGDFQRFLGDFRPIFSDFEG